MTDKTQPGAEADSRATALDLDKLEELARAAQGWNLDAVQGAQLGAIGDDGEFNDILTVDADQYGQADEDNNSVVLSYLAAANPAAVLALIAQARRATAPHAALIDLHKLTRFEPDAIAGQGEAVADMVEDTNGDYILLADVQAMLAAQPVEAAKNTEPTGLRAAFELTEQGSDLSKGFVFGSDGEYANPAVQNRWVGFQRGAAPVEAAGAVQAEPSQITDTESARKFVDAWHRKHFPTDRTFSRYIMADPARSNPLAGDFAWQLAKALESMAASQACGEQVASNFETEIAHRLRLHATNLNLSQDLRDALEAGASEVDRFYKGMMAWKRTAEKKDRDWNEARMAFENYKCAQRDSAPATGAQVAKAEQEPFMWIDPEQLKWERLTSYANVIEVTGHSVKFGHATMPLYAAPTESAAAPADIIEQAAQIVENAHSAYIDKTGKKVIAHAIRALATTQPTTQAGGK